MAKGSIYKKFIFSAIIKQLNSLFYSKRKLLLVDFQSSNDLENPNNRLKYWDASQKIVKNQKKKIKLLTNQNNYLRNKIKSMTTLLKQLKEEND